MSQARNTARKVLFRVENGGAFAAAALAAETAKLKDERDAALTYELVLGCLRRESWLDHLLGLVADKGLKKIDPEVMRILRVGAYQIAFLSRIPPSAAVNDAVSACRRSRAARLSGLVNALLRKLSSMPPDELVPKDEDDGVDIEILALRCGLPAFVLEAFVSRFGRGRALDIARAFNGPSRRTLRVNTHLISMQEAEQLLNKSSKGMFSPWALDVFSQKDAASLIDEGKAAYQDEAAQLAVLALAPNPENTVLDACAGRGGKSAAAAMMTKNRARLFASDRSKSKLDRLVFELSKQQLSARTEVCDLSKAPPVSCAMFDKVLVDAPCSGSGTLGRRPEIRKRLTRASIDELVRVQRAMLFNAAKVTAPKGRLVFVVCSLLEPEGFDHAGPFLEAHPSFSFVSAPPPNWPAAVAWNNGQVLIDPSAHRTDGYQILVFEKAG